MSSWVEEKIRVAEFLEEFGGPFEKAMGRVIRVAPSDKLNRLRLAFPEIFKNFNDWNSECVEPQKLTKTSRV